MLVHIKNITQDGEEETKIEESEEEDEIPLVSNTHRILYNQPRFQQSGRFISYKKWMGLSSYDMKMMKFLFVSTKDFPFLSFLNFPFHIIDTKWKIMKFLFALTVGKIWLYPHLSHVHLKRMLQFLFSNHRLAIMSKM